MEFTLDTLKKDEQVSLSLRKLYEQFGYKKYKVSKFEAYELYLENKNFLKVSRSLLLMTWMESCWH